MKPLLKTNEDMHKKNTTYIYYSSKLIQMLSKSWKQIQIMIHAIQLIYNFMYIKSKKVKPAHKKNKIKHGC